MACTSVSQPLLSPHCSALSARRQHVDRDFAMARPSARQFALPAKGARVQLGQGRRRRHCLAARALAGNQGPRLPDLSLPKFMPFTPQNALQQAMLSYRFRQEVGPDGATLLVTALTADWISSAADLLTESFAMALGAAPYTNFLRRQVKAYLEQHNRLPPKAVVLVALLLPAELSEAAAEELGATVPMAPAAATARAAPSSASSGGGGVDSTDDAMAQGAPGAVTAWQGQLGWQQQEQEEQGDVPELGDGMAMHPLLDMLPATSSSSSSSGSSSDDEPASGAVLAGVVELSFSASTRSQYMTLNPPADRPYLCNMAVKQDLRGRGYGFVLLKAAEELVAQLGENEVYLHLRVQDEPAAALYKKSGFEEVAADTFLVRFLGMDQRRLMRKRLARPAALAAGQQAAAGGAAAPAPAVQQKMRMDL